MIAFYHSYTLVVRISLLECLPKIVPAVTKQRLELINVQQVEGRKRTIFSSEVLQMHKMVQVIH